MLWCPQSEHHSIVGLGLNCAGVLTRMYCNEPNPIHTGGNQRMGNSTWWAT